MRSVTISSLSASLLASTVVASTINSRSIFDPKNFKASDIITRDVAVVGGGSAGTYSAVGLKDKGKSVVIIEKQGQLGGHAETYTDPNGTPVDMGVVILHNTTTVKNYLTRLAVGYIDAAFFNPSPLDYDTRTGKQVTRTSNPTGAEIGAAFTEYLKQLGKYPALNNGTYLPNPVPEELYMPFGDFIKKYKLEAALPTMHNFNPGVGDILANPTVEQFRYWGQGMVTHSLGTPEPFMTTSNHNTSEIYSKAALEFPGSSLLLKSVVVASDRSGKDGVKLIVKTPTGNKLILAKKLLIAIPPKLDIVAPFDLSSQEKKIFGKWINHGYYVGIVKNTGLPDNTSITNAAQNTEYNLPVLPGMYSISGTGVPEKFMVYYGTPASTKSFPIPDEKVKSEIIASIKRVQKSNPKYNQTEPEWVDFRSHAPYTLQAKAEDIKDGFYEKLYALQGQRNTFWNGAAWRAEDSSILWRFSEEVVLPKILASF